MKEAAEALKKAFELLKKHEHLGLMESHDTMQQIGNLVNMLIVGKEYMKTVYRYLHSLYIRCKKPALAQKYKGKYLESSKNKLKISPCCNCPSLSDSKRRIQDVP